MSMKIEVKKMIKIEIGVPFRVREGDLEYNVILTSHDNVLLYWDRMGERDWVCWRKEACMAKFKKSEWVLIQE